MCHDRHYAVSVVNQSVVIFIMLRWRQTLAKHKLTFHQGGPVEGKSMLSVDEKIKMLKQELMRWIALQ